MWVEYRLEQTVIESVLAKSGNVDAAQTLATMRGGRRAVETLVPFLEESDTDLRMQAASILGYMGPAAQAAIPALIQALSDPSEDVRCCAASALGRIGAPASAAVPTLISKLEDESVYVRRWAAYGLGGIGPAAEPAIPALASLAAEETSFQLRRDVAWTLGKIGSDDTIVLSLLTELQGDENAEVAAAARDAMRQLGVESE